MKRYTLVSSIFLFSLSISLVSGADISTKEANSSINGEVFQEASAEVQSIEVGFCENDAKTKKYQINAGDIQDICLEVSNNASKDIMVSLDFVDGTFTNDQRKNRACLDSNQKEKFGQYVTGNKNSLIIPAKSSIITHANMQYPRGIVGEINGCLVYYTKGVSGGGSVDFSILVRRAKFIDVTILPGFFAIYQRYIFGAALAIIILLLYSIKKFIRRKK
ncbi:MAG: hypothetical protein NT085_03475 [candidate division SR1 bacterium]|nr:hypothetical protein [candidate division SR1 bacterium]